MLTAHRTDADSIVNTQVDQRCGTHAKARLVDGRFQVTNVELTHDAAYYVGRWLDPVDV